MSQSHKYLRLFPKSVGLSSLLHTDVYKRQVQHYLDCFGGGHFAGRPELVKRLVMEAPDAIKWLNELGVEFDKEADGDMITTHGGGTSRKRMHAAKDYSGAEIMRTIRDEVINLGIPVVEFTSAVELLKDEKGQVAGAVLQNMETEDYLVARAKTVVIATGGAGRMHYQGFPTSNHYGATADGLVLGYRAGAPLLYQDSIQYHPTGAVYQMCIRDRDKLMTNPCTAQSDELLCNGCSTCANVCPYGAISYEEKEVNDHGIRETRRIAKVNTALCQGCGACTVACPSGAMDLQGFSNRQILAEVDAICQ